jgi:hypothetical protein
MKFVDQLPADGRSATPIEIAPLRESPGRWAEAQRYPKDKRSAASSRGRHFVSLHEGAEYTTRTVGDEVVLFVRAVAR